MVPASRGFTLIELLVVIAIIGILSSVVLASLGAARDKGQDAAVKADMQSIRSQAEVYYDNNPSGNSYTGVCTGDAMVVSQLTAAAKAAGKTYPTDIYCNVSSTGGAWAAAAPLKSGGAYCVDSTGNMKSTQGSGTTAYTGVTGAGTAVAITTGGSVCN